MIPVKQTVLHDPANGKIGNCFSAVLASLLHLPIEIIPNFQDPVTWQKDLNEWLRPYGLAHIQLEDYDIWTDMLGVVGSYHSISGNTVRSADVSHACVGLNAQVAFDPHPSDVGLSKVRTCGVFVALRPWEVAKLNMMTVSKAREVLCENSYYLINRTIEKDVFINTVDNGFSAELSGSYTKEQLQAIVFLMEENEKAKPICKNVTKEEHNILMAATLRSSTLIAKGRFVDMPAQWNGTSETPPEQLSTPE